MNQDNAGNINQEGRDHINYNKLVNVLCKSLSTDITGADYYVTQLHGGTVGDVKLIRGIAVAASGKKLPYRLVLKTQKKWERYGDPGSWRREYDLYSSELSRLFTDSLRWPDCYLAEMDDDEFRLWLEYIDGISGLDLTGAMYEQAAYELGRFQGALYAGQPPILKGIGNLSKADAMKNFYLHYRSWNEVYDYVRSSDCPIPRHLCDMIIDMDEKSDEIWGFIETLPIVLCHRDFWVTNIFCRDGKFILIDWDTTGWGHLGEDIVSLIADEADVVNMLEYYKKCVPAYRRGFSEYTDISHIGSIYIRERIILHYGYRIVEWYKFAGSPENKAMHLDTLQKIYEMGEIDLKDFICP